MRYLGRRARAVQSAPTRARRNVAHHYDLDGRLYSLFLDADRQYSCAYFENPEQSLDDAQLAKKRHLAAKLLLEPGKRVLDIGCGWGGLGLYLAEICRRRRHRHHAVAGAARASPTSARPKRASPGRRDFLLQDYRDVARAIRPHRLGRHVRACRRRSSTTPSSANARELLADDGVMLLHSIGRSEGPGITNPWIAKYIFPGGYIPALSEVLPRDRDAPDCWSPTSRSCACITPRRCKHWRERFLAHREEAERIYDPRFVRMWEFYLAASEMAFREQAMMVFQIQLTKRQGVVPMTRDYIAREERRLRALEGEPAPAAAAGRRVSAHFMFDRA